MNHALDGFFVVITQINHARLCFAKLITACTVKESRARAQDGAVHCPLFRMTSDSEIGIFPA